jgi:phosphoglucosamine mutase
MSIINHFGTDGIRDHVGSGMLSGSGLPRIGNAIGRWAVQKYGPGAAILLINDTRASCQWVKATLQSGILLHPVHITDALVLPSPAAMHLMGDQFDCAVIISASHNKWSDNGIKIMSRQTGKLTLEDEITISSFIEEPVILDSRTFATYDLEPAFKDIYIQKLIWQFPSQLLSGKKIVLDVAHGATYEVAPAIFKALGAAVVTLHNRPTGYNINDQCGTLHLKALQHAILETNAHVGFAFDGDGDRVIAINKQGIIKDGDDILALLSQHPAYKDEKTVVGTVMSNEGLAHFLKTAGKSFLRTQVGDKHILEQLAADNLTLGGEPAGHIICKDIIPTGDGILTALRVCEALLFSRNDEFATFEKFPQTLINIPIKIKKDLTQSPFHQIITAMQERLSSGRILVRFSGTEPLLRIMVEAPCSQIAQSIAQELSAQLSSILGT